MNIVISTVYGKHSTSYCKGIKFILSEKIQKALNSQINTEMYSAYLYLSMSAYFESINLPGFANWMQIQAQEELTHAMKIYNHINERSGRIKLGAIEEPISEWSSPLEVFRNAYSHEQKVTGLINKLVDLAISESDHATNIFLQWFVTEQIEEEMNADGIVQKLKLAGDSPNALLMLDSELMGRTFMLPASGDK